MRFWPSSGSRSCTRTTRCARSGPPSSSVVRSPRLNDRLDAAFGVRIEVRTGVNTGEVIAGDPEQGQAFATGDAVNVAQRLEAAAAGGEILVGDSTIRLVRDAVVAEPVPPLELKGKSEPVDVWRLHDVLPDAAGVTRRIDTPLVGRVVELARCWLSRPGRLGAGLPNRHGPRRAGVGKSRLAAELVASCGEDAHVLEGPLPAVRERDHLLAARRDRPRARPRARSWPGSPTARPCMAGSSRPSDAPSQHSRSDELYWAFRRLLETLARQRPCCSFSTTSSGRSRRSSI